MAWLMLNGRFVETIINCGVKLEMKSDIAIEMKFFPKVVKGVLDATNINIPEMMPKIKNKMN